MSFVERTKNEVHQTRIPNMSGGGTKVMDSAYNHRLIWKTYLHKLLKVEALKVEVLTMVKT